MNPILTESMLSDSVTRRVADSYWKFVEDLGIHVVLDRRGKRLFSSGDAAFSRVAARAGLAFGVFPELRIIHLISARRLRRHYLVQLIRDSALTSGVLNYVLDGAQPERANLECYVRLLLTGMKNGLFSMRCRWAESRGKDGAAQLISVNHLSPGRALTTVPGEPAYRPASTFFRYSDLTTQPYVTCTRAEREESVVTT